METPNFTGNYVLADEMMYIRRGVKEVTSTTYLRQKSTELKILHIVSVHFRKRISVVRLPCGCISHDRCHQQENLHKRAPNIVNILELRPWVLVFAVEREQCAHITIVLDLADATANAGYQLPSAAAHGCWFIAREQE